VFWNTSGPRLRPEGGDRRLRNHSERRRSPGDVLGTKWESHKESGYCRGSFIKAGEESAERSYTSQEEKLGTGIQREARQRAGTADGMREPKERVSKK